MLPALYRRVEVAVVCVFALLLPGGCATTAKQVGAAAAPEVVKAGLKEANAPDAQMQIQHFVDTNAFQNAGQSVGEGVGIGLFNEANKLAGVAPNGASAASQPNTKTTQPSTRPGDTAATPGAAAVAGLAGGGGGINSFVQSSVQTAFLAATDPKFKEGERAMAEAIGEGVLQGMMTVLDKEGPRLGRTVQTQLGPIIQMVIRDQLAPAIQDTMEKQIAPAALRVWKEGAVETLKLTVRPDLQPDVMKNAENASVGASRGTTQGLINAGVLAPGGGLTPRVRVYAWAVLGAVVLIGLALFCLLLLLNLLVLRHLLRRRTPADARPTLPQKV